MQWKLWLGRFLNLYLLWQGGLKWRISLCYLFLCSFFQRFAAYWCSSQTCFHLNPGCGITGGGAALKKKSWKSQCSAQYPCPLVLSMLLKCPFIAVTARLGTHFPRHILSPTPRSSSVTHSYRKHSCLIWVFPRLLDLICCCSFI